MLTDGERLAELESRQVKTDWLIAALSSQVSDHHLWINGKDGVGGADRKINEQGFRLSVIQYVGGALYSGILVVLGAILSKI